MLPQRLLLGTPAATFSSFEKVSQLTVKECILNSAIMLLCKGM